VISKLSNLQFSIAVKQRLGINLVNPLPAVCPCCEGDASLRDDATHLLGCPNLSRTALTRRHDALVSHLAAWCNSVKMPAFVEPKINGQRRRPDVDIILNQGRVLVDVSFVHPSSATYVRHHNAMTSAVSPLHAREQVKTSKYGRLAQEAQAELVPFVVSSFGGFGGSAMRFFAKLREAVAAMDPVPWSSDPVGDLVRELCVIAQRGNKHRLSLGTVAVVELQQRLRDLSRCEYSTGDVQSAQKVQNVLWNGCPKGKGCTQGRSHLVVQGWCCADSDCPSLVGQLGSQVYVEFAHEESRARCCETAGTRPTGKRQSAVC
jgi:hypothetical protein